MYSRKPHFFISTIISRIPNAIYAQNFFTDMSSTYLEYKNASGLPVNTNTGFYLRIVSMIYDFVMEGLLYGFGFIGIVYLLFTNRPFALLLLAPILSRALPFSILHVEPRWIIVGQGTFAIFSGISIYTIIRWITNRWKRND